MSIIISPLPYNLVNGQAIDATPVMANLNEIYNDVNANAAKNGANSDITSIASLSTPLSIAQGGTGGNSVSALQALISPPVFQCRMDMISASILRLSRRLGSWVFIAGVFRQIPAAGVDLAPTGATAFTTYNIYAFWNGTAIQLEFSLTARATDATYGHQIKSGDPTRTLVGKAYVQAGPVWDINNLLLTASYYNRLRRVSTQALATTTGQLNPTAPNAIAGMSTYSLSWAEDATEVDADVTEMLSIGNLVVFNFAIIRNSAAASVLGSNSGGYLQAAFASYYGTAHARVVAVVSESLGLNTSGTAYNENVAAAYQNGGGSYQVLAGSTTITAIMG